MSSANESRDMTKKRPCPKCNSYKYQLYDDGYKTCKCVCGCIYFAYDADIRKPFR